MKQTTHRGGRPPGRSTSSISTDVLLLTMFAQGSTYDEMGKKAGMTRQGAQIRLHRLGYRRYKPKGWKKVSL